MKTSHIEMLIKSGKEIEVLVTQDRTFPDRINIRDCQFVDFNRAARYLTHIAQTELPENFIHLIG